MTNLWCQGLNIQETWKSQGCASYSSTSSFVFPTAGAVSLSEVCGHFQDHIQTTGCDWLFTWFLQVLVHGLCTVVPLYCTWNTCSCLQGSILLFPPPQDSEHKHPESHMAPAELGAESFTRWSMPRMALGEKEVTNAILDPAMSTHLTGLTGSNPGMERLSWLQRIILCLKSTKRVEYQSLSLWGFSVHPEHTCIM